MIKVRSVVRGVIAGVGVVGVVLACAVPATAQALPKGAYWYDLWDLQNVWKITRGADVTVAVVDSGVQASLGDLQGQVLPGLDLSGTGTGADHDTPEGSGTFGHGSDMAALIAGTGKGGGIVGVAPSAKILPVRLPASLPNDAAAQGIRWAVAHGADVINLSFGNPASCDPTIGAAIKDAYQHGVIVVAAAGDSTGPVSTPADCPGALAVGGVDINFKSWTQTPNGPSISFVAPAYNLVNEELDNTANGPNPANSGTSAAAALVSGVFALLHAKFPHDTARQLVTRGLYAVKNGLGAGHLSQRISDYLGYGEILPRFALTQTLPANAKNPIFDQFDKQLGLTSTGGSSTPTNTTTPGSASNTPTTTTPPSTASNNDSNSGFPTLAIVAIVVVVVIGAGIVLVRRSRRPNHSGPGGPGGPYYPPPPPSGY